LTKENHAGAVPSIDAKYLNVVVFLLARLIKFGDDGFAQIMLRLPILSGAFLNQPPANRPHLLFILRMHGH
jgi:hypothetical protein